ncbi:DUF5696 domain-containing protein [Cohnella yongneupensis]|uniref:DUF5696 domain-containing protein n=1 Tax=Cohnella yongneupensis TaxID=425006 RepID=A0ABW0QX34_9BACL
MRLARKSLLIAFCSVGVMIAGCSDSKPDNQAKTTDQSVVAFSPGKPLSASFSDPRVEGMKGVAENDQLRLFADDQSGTIAVLNKKTGAIWYSNPPGRESDSLASGINKDLLSSQMRIDFYNNLGQLSSINSYTESVAYKQIQMEPIPNGVRAVYQFGKAQKSFEDMPQMLTKARFDELTSKLDKTAQRAMKIAYKEDSEKKDILVRNDSALQGIQLDKALKAFEAIGYTEEDLKKDAAALNLDQTKSEPRIFQASIEYTLDADSLIAKIPVSSIHYPKEYPVNMVTMLSFFGAEGPDAEGALFVPDGSGSLIRFNNGKTRYPSYQQLVYGADQTIDRTEDAAREQDVRLPVFGILRKDEAFLGIIEEGAAEATINADVAGRLNGYNYVYPSFNVINKDEVTLFANEQQRSLPKFQENPMKTDYAVRYAFLSGEDASYQGMAKYYQQYLQQKNGLPKQSVDAKEDVPFYLQLVGSIDKKKHLLGIPYNTLESLTTFEQAESIVAQAQQRDIRNLKVKFAGWFNGGLDHEVPDHVSVDKAVGGSKGLEKFTAFAQEKGISFFPDVALLVANSGASFDENDDAARTLRDDPAMLFPINLATNRRDRMKPPSYVVSPRLVGDYVDTVLKSLKNYNSGGISLRDMTESLNSDYRKNQQIDRVQSQGISTQSLSKMRDDHLSIMGNGGNAYALPYLTDITNAPMSNSKFKIEDESIPFYQMVLHGYIDYTGTPYNLSTYNDVQQYVLKCLEYGAGVYFEWIYEPNYKVKDTDFDSLYAVNYELWIDQAAEIYKEVNGVLGDVQNQRIVSHEKLGEGVFKTVYENGKYVIVNYNRSEVQLDGKKIEAESYVTGGEQS